MRRQRPVIWGTLRRRRPFSDYWGFDRGLPVDRFYIERFLDRWREDIGGAVLEVGEREYAERFGGDRVISSDLIDIDASNEDATIIGDLAVAGSVPPGRFGCVLVTQTLQYVDDPQAAVANLWAGTARGGTLLITAPCVQRIDPELPDVDRWRFTPRGLEDLVRRGCLGGDAEVTGYGNVLTSAAFLMGLAAEELRPRDLDYVDPAFPLVACARVAKPST